MPSCVYITDPDWLDGLARTGIRDGVNFWRRDRRQYHLLPGDAFYFKVDGSQTIGGRGYFREQLNLSLDEAWTRFGNGNGAETRDAFDEMTRRITRETNGILNCLVLDGVDILPPTAQPLLPAGFFRTGIQQGKFFEPGTLESIEDPFSTSIGEFDVINALEHERERSAFDPKYISSVRSAVLRSVCERRGQRSFRNKLLTAYDFRCAITGEVQIDVLEAAHIYPYHGVDTDKTSNGLLLRSDWHALFDLGLWTMGTDFAITLSDRLTSAAYRESAGRQLRLPFKSADQPSKAAISYHRSRIFRV